MDINEIKAISPIDGRYWSKTNQLSDYFSEFALIKYRVRVEIEYFIKLSDFIPEAFSSVISTQEREFLRDIYRNFSEEDAHEIKEIEKATNHDVKAVEYFIKNKISGTELEKLKEWIHFGLTSQDINNTAIPLASKEAWHRIVLAQIEELISKLEELASEWADIPMLAKTHGQPASPTLLGKEIKVFSERLKSQVAQFNDEHFFTTKFGGATGNLNAHYVTFPDKDWVDFADDFSENTLGLKRTRYTTQIEPYDNFASFFDANKRINNILIDLSRDMWTYISMHYFTQKIKAGEIGSSAMPHKVNPIDFENAEGNLGLANALLEHLSSKLTKSRLQRDLTDSTVLRNVGVPLAHGIIAYKSLLKGLGKVQLHRETINRDLDDNLVVVAEAIQNILRVIAYPNPYETLKELTRTNEKLTREKLDNFIDSLDVSSEIKERLKSITPSNYTGKN